MHKYGELKSMYKSNNKCVLTFQNGVIIVSLGRSYDDMWLEVEELTHTETEKVSDNSS